jgi:predicted amidohydrolase YtcJ
MKLATAVFLMTVISIAAAQDQPTTAADLIFIHGNIYPGAGAAPSFHPFPRAEAMAIRGDRVAAVGAQSDVLKLKGSGTKVVDLGGHFVMPGFNDAHVHLAEAGMQKLTLDLVGVKSLADFLERIRSRAAARGPGEWIVGGGWDHTLWPVKEVPSRQDIDAVSGDHPVFLQRVDGHIAVANTKALQLALVTLATKAPEGGQIDHDASGQPTGILREGARALVTAVIPPLTRDQRRKAIEAALNDAAQWGVTSLQDNSSWADFEVYAELEREGKLTARITEWLAFDDPLQTLLSERAAHSQSDDMLHTAMLKGFMDGSLGSRTAALHEPYTDDSNNTGLPQYEPSKLAAMAKERVVAGFQMGFHAIGDTGVQMALDAFAEAEKDAREKGVKAPDGGDDYRFRIEHAQVTTPAQIARFKQLGVVASMQPNHVLTDMNWAIARLGPQRAAHSYAWAEFLKNGVALAFGTDYPVEPITPFRGMYAAVTRKSEDGKREYFPEQKLTIDQAIAAYTTGSAFAQFAEKEKGTLAPGMLADFVILDRDLSSVAPEKILGTKVLRTVVGGKTVYEAK